MAQDTIVTLFGKIFASGWVSSDLTVIWHAGEPLVLPIACYQTAFETIEAMRPGSLRPRHAIQTNAMLITPEWCACFRTWDVGLGVSIDGSESLRDANRVTRSGRRTFDRTIAGVRLLQRENVPFHVISVLSPYGMDAPGDMLDPQKQFRGFLDHFWRWARQDGRIRFIREIDGMLPRVFRPEQSPMHNPQVRPFGMPNVDCQGRALPNRARTRTG
jgi:uncharacterized protein